MQVLLFVVIGLAVCAAFMTIVVMSPDFRRKTCRDCGGELPVIRLANQSEDPALGDWACPKCGTKFDRRGRARDQLATQTAVVRRFGARDARYS